MMYLHKELKDTALKLIDMKNTEDDIKAGTDLASINDMLTLLAMSPNYVEAGIALDKKIYGKYPEIQSLCDAADAMRNAFGLNANNYCGAGKTVQQKVIDDLTTDYFGILASVLIKHNVIPTLKDFIHAVD